MMRTRTRASILQERGEGFLSTSRLPMYSEGWGPTSTKCKQFLSLDPLGRYMMAALHPRKVNTQRTLEGQDLERKLYYKTIPLSSAERDDATVQVIADLARARMLLEDHYYARCTPWHQEPLSHNHRPLKINMHALRHSLRQQAIKRGQLIMQRSLVLVTFIASRIGSVLLPIKTI